LHHTLITSVQYMTSFWLRLTNDAFLRHPVFWTLRLSRSTMFQTALRSILLSLISPHRIWPHLNWPHFIWTECSVIGCSHGQLGRVLWSDPIRRGCDQSQHNEVSWGKVRWVITRRLANAEQLDALIIHTWVKNFLFFHTQTGLLQQNLGSPDTTIRVGFRTEVAKSPNYPAWCRLSLRDDNNPPTSQPDGRTTCSSHKREMLT